MNQTATNRELENARAVPIQNLMGVKITKAKQHVVCPFHSDRSPSMVIYPDNSWYCFGCNAHGDNAIDFCIELGYTFKETLEELNKY